MRLPDRYFVYNPETNMVSILILDATGMSYDKGDSMPLDFFVHYVEMAVESLGIFGRAKEGYEGILGRMCPDDVGFYGPPQVVPDVVKKAFNDYGKGGEF